MGTNYYAKKGELEIHIGKVSYGLKPMYHESDYFNDLESLIKFISKDDVIIKDEYGTEYTVDEFREEFILKDRGDRTPTHNYIEGDRYWASKERILS